MRQSLKIGIILLGMLGFFGVTKISYQHWIEASSCPMLGAIPACYVIFIAYAMVVVSMLLSAQRQKKVFIFFWLPVIILALLGTMGELTGLAACPHTETGIPKCYFSAILSALIGLLAWFYFKIEGDYTNR